MCYYGGLCTKRRGRTALYKAGDGEQPGRRTSHPDASALASTAGRTRTHNSITEAAQEATENVSRYRARHDAASPGPVDDAVRRVLISELLLDCVAVSVFYRHVPDLHHLAHAAHLAENL